MSIPVLSRLSGRALALRAGAKAALRRALRGAEHKPGAEIPAIADGARAGLALAAIVKDEAPYLREWLEFHLMLGVRRVHIYDNGSTDETPDVLAPFIARGEVAVTPWRNFCGFESAQRLAYAHAIANFGPDHRWMAFIDVDEFLFPTEAESLPQALEALAHLPGFVVPWRNFGPDGHETRPDGLVIEAYRECAAFPPRPDQRALLRYKSVIDPRAAAASDTHMFPLRGLGSVALNQRGARARFHATREAAFAAEGPLRLNHYFTRSLAEMRARVAKGRVSGYGAVSADYLDRRLACYRRAVMRDEAILRFAAPLRARMAARAAAGPRMATSDEARG